MLKRKSKRVLSIVLAVAMIVGLFPIAAFADDSVVTVSNETELVNALSAKSNTTVVLSNDIATKQTLQVSGTHVLDLGTNTLTSTLAGHAIVVNANANFTLSNGSLVYKSTHETAVPDAIFSYNNTVTTLSANASVQSSGGGIVCGDSSTNSNSNAQLNVFGTINCQDIGVWSQGGKNIVNINGAKITSKYFGVYQNGSAGGSTFNIINSTISDSSDNGAGIYISNSSAHEKQTVVIENSVITGATGVEVKFTNVDISGENTKITATKTPADVTQSGNGSTTVGYAFALSHNGTKTTEDAADGIVSIKNGSFDGLVDIMEPTLGAETKGDITVTGGTFSNVNKDKLEQFIPEGNKLDEKGSVAIDETKAVASVDGVGYTSLQDAIDAAPAGGTITILKDIDLDGTGKGNTEGLLTITKDVTIIGNSHKITAKDGTVSVSGNNGPSMINVQSGAKVTINDLIINGGTNDTFTAGTKHGININQAGTVTLNDVSIQNNRWYAVMNNGSDLVLKGLTTSGNQWGINVDNKGGDANLIVNNAGIAEESSIVFDKGGIGKITATINGGSFRDVVMGKDANEEPITTIDSLIINGGTFKTAGIANAIDVEDYLAPGLVYNPYTGQVYKEPEYTGKYSYEIFTKVGENGTISVDRYATEGDDVTITVSPDEAYLLDELTVTAGGKEVEVKDNGDGTYTFKMPSADAKIVVTFAEDPDWEPEPEEPAMPFTDVNENDWFYDVVLYAYDNGLMTGVSATEFAPNQTTTRGMIVSMLARLEGVTSAEDAGFADVAANDWYATAVNWAASVGVVNGYEDNTFRPNAPITREQMAAILYNYADYKGYDVSARADLSDYADAASISSWAEDVLAWANAEGLINGMTATTIDPQGATTRAQTAAMFERFLTAHEA